MANETRYLLKIDSLVTGYGKKQVVNGVSLEVYEGEIVALIGHNGAGKSTLLKAIFGLIPIWKGQATFDGNHLNSPTPRSLLRVGIAYVPQGNRVFTDLTVRENLQIGGATLSNKKCLNERIEYALTLFPSLKHRMRQRAGSLSGGEKQMLALANIMVLAPRLLLLDEPSLGLAPQLLTESFNRIKQINLDSSVSILIVEQKVREVLKLAQRVYVLRNGLVSFSGSANTLNDDTRIREVYF